MEYYIGLMILPQLAINVHRFIVENVFFLSIWVLAKKMRLTFFKIIYILDSAADAKELYRKFKDVII
jgi:hypothetical protein